MQKHYISHQNMLAHLSCKTFLRGLAEVGKPAQDDTSAEGAESGNCFMLTASINPISELN